MSGSIRTWTQKLLEALLSTLPVFLVVLLIYLLGTVWQVQILGWPNDVTDPPLSHETFLTFSISSIFVALGLAFFNVGSEKSMTKIGAVIADSLVKKKKMFLILMMSFVLGAAITIAEPDLTVLGEEIGEAFLNKWVLILIIGVSVGVFLALGVVRVLFGRSLLLWFITFYGLVFALALLVEHNHDISVLPICFDGGGVTAGAVTVPFVLAFGAGFAASRSSGGNSSADDTFGFVALSSVGPILFMEFMAIVLKVDLSSLIYHPGDAYTFGGALVYSLYSVAIAIAPIVVIFLVYNYTVMKLPTITVIKICIGLLYSYIGLTLLFTGVYSGFYKVAKELGMSLGGSTGGALPVAMTLACLFGMFGVLAEPAIHALCAQVEDVSEGTIKKGLVLAVLAISIGLADLLHIVRVYFGFSIIYYLVPGYIIAFCLAFCVPKIYTGIAFDSGGVASGPMTATFVSPFCIGYAYSLLEARYAEQAGSGAEALSEAWTSEVYAFGFGLVATMAVMPLIAIQGLGLVAVMKKNASLKRARARIVEENDDQVIHFVEEVA